MHAGHTRIADRLYNHLLQTQPTTNSILIALALFSLLVIVVVSPVVLVLSVVLVL